MLKRLQCSVYYIVCNLYNCIIYVPIYIQCRALISNEWRYFWNILQYLNWHSEKLIDYILEWLILGGLLTDSIFETGAYRVPSKSLNPTVLGQGGPCSTQCSHPSRACCWRHPFDTVHNQVFIPALIFFLAKIGLEITSTLDSGINIGVRFFWKKIISKMTSMPRLI